MAPPSIMGRSQGLYPEQPRQGQSQMDALRTWRLKNRTPGMGSLRSDLLPGGYDLFQTSPLTTTPRSRGGSPDLVGTRQMPLYGQSMLPEMNTQTLNGQGPLRKFGREGLSPLFNVPPQSPYRPGSAPGMSVLGGGEMAAQDAIQGMIDQIRGGREELRNGRLRQEELRQGRFDQNWSEYANQAPLMNQYQSPQFAQTNQGLGPGGVAPMTPEEQAYMARRNAYTDQPGTSQMYDRFGSGPLTGEALQGFAPSAFNNDYDGQVRMQPGGYGSPLSGPLGKSQDPEFSDEAVARRQQERMARIKAEQVWNGEGGLPPGANPRLRQARKDIDDRREAMGLRRSDDMRGRIADRDAARAERLRSGQAQNLSRRGISPLSAEGQSLAPELYGSLRAQRSGAPAGQGSPLTAADGTPIKPVPQTGTRSATAVQEARTASHAMLSQRPVFRSLGIDAGASPDDMPAPWQVIQQVNDGVTAQNLAMSPQEIQQLHEYAVQTYQADPKAFSGEGATSVPEQEAMGMWSSLAQMPLDRPDQRQQWWDRYQTWLNRPKAAPASRPYFSDPRAAL
jgi:hypothetical protein